MTIVKTDKINDINENEFKEIVSITSSLIKYQGNEYLEKLKKLNAEYKIPNQRFIYEKNYFS